MRLDVEIYDTTLRDGSQGEGINFSVTDKLRLAERLDTFGVSFIEGGWPGSNPKDIEFFATARTRKFRHARVAAFGSTRRKGVRVESDDQVRLLLDAETPVVTIFGKTWLLHVQEVLRTSPDENLSMIADTIRFLKDHDKFVVYDAEHAFDGFKDNPEYALATLAAADKGGADRVVLCDTNGGSLTADVARIITEVRGRISASLGMHPHNDIGLGVANALVAVESGAVHVQGTINGYGERTGNCNLTSVIPALAFKMKKRCIPEGSLRKLRDVSQFVDEIANVRHDPRQPWVGATAFAHKGGMHVNAVQKNPHSFEHIDPELVGNRRRVLISDLAGRSNIVMKAQELGIPLHNDSPELREILNRIKDLEHQGYEFEAAEASLALLIWKARTPVDPKFVVDAYHVSMRSSKGDSICEATIKVRVGDKAAHTVAEGDGPINALDSALRSALVGFYPQLKKVHLTDYKVRILDSASGTAAKTRVLIESSDGRREWGTVGVSSNIIEASLQALIDSIEYLLMGKP
jgi:2-isopropylmalate synthase